MAQTKVKYKEPTSFEEAMRELDALTASMESGDFALEQSLAAYQRGAYLVKYCQAQLQAIEQQVKIVENDMVKPFDLNTGAAV
ncbi:Exodeoxyribonuclease 7 small subunit [Ephemeroptericola cinctiostellae]|uniref:Exodeoxyribonuclease 7 small subunit n=1 Tax=Ephemeroptericola cinctiostellae TaxID=2268024 RepID=A0A345DAN1_9BURK|nr:exodeoxyribonuclease VII small subunit [Ephemeroptericola cinctiostellae]AXF85419.1 Exodeoxyribonuclease 7 small subunit [Ephemeroptericola cinctiostellae]